MKRIALAVVLLVTLVGPVRADCYYESITTPSPFLGNGGEIVKLGNGSFWKVTSFHYLYLYRYYPTVLFCPEKGLMILDDHQFSMVRMDCNEATIMKPAPFLGNGGEMIMLDDGTIWQDISYQYLYLYEYHPTVAICPSKGLMILDDDQFDVIQIK